MTEAKDSEVCKITRADGSSSFHGDFQALLRRLDRQDLSQLYSLVQEIFKNHPLEGHDLDLWGDLRMIFDSNEEDDIWLNQQYWELLRWKLHEYSSVHSLFLDGTSIQINMLVEKKYQLKKEILEKMINLKIEAEEECTMAHELIKFIKSQIAEQREDCWELKSFYKIMLLKDLILLVVIVFSTWMAFGGNTRDLGSFREERDKITDLHQILKEVLLTGRRDGIVGIKRRRRDPSSDDVRELVTASGRGRLNEDLESST
ncbi:hypothetical protein Tco_0960187 [Tanacetum coccineum]